MAGKCKLIECPAPEAPCHLTNDDYTQCENFVVEATVQKSKKEKVRELKKSSMGWSGQAFTADELALISSRTSPILIGVVGKADAGKTSFLAMLYTLLLSGKKLNGYNFAGTKTILGWDSLYHRLKFKKGSVAFPQPTPVTSNRLYHLALRNEEEQLKDVLFADASGEVFTLWSVNRNDENAENARWIYSNSNAFMLFIDCEALLIDKNAAKKDVMLIARQLTHDLKNRPVIAVWSKADKKTDVLPSIKDTLTAELKALFSNYDEIEISNFLEPGPDELVHINNLAVVDWLLERIMIPSAPDLSLDQIVSDDLFINYKGR
jgi:Double-GTPase 2